MHEPEGRGHRMLIEEKAKDGYLCTSCTSRSGKIAPNARVFQRLVRWLSPWEAAFMHLQSLLVWENTVPSLIFTAAIHLFFWYVALSNHGTYFVICLGLLIIVLLDLWKGYIWPEIKDTQSFGNLLSTFGNKQRSVPDEFDNEEDWVPMHARLLSIHDISLVLAEQYTVWSQRIDSYFALRKSKHLFFCILSCIMWLSLAYLGRRLSGTALVYLTFVTVMTLPCLVYHGILDAFKSRAMPILHRIDQHLDEQGRLEDPHDASIQEEEMCPPSDRLSRDIEKELRDSKATGDIDSDDELLDFIPQEEVSLDAVEGDLASGIMADEIEEVLAGDEMR